MSGKQLEYNRKRLGLTPKSMAKILVANLKDYQRFEKNGLRIPHDVEGPTLRIVQVLISNKSKTVWRKLLDYNGPEKKYKDIELMYKS